MGTKNKPGEFDCYENAEPDEPMFVLLARDPLAPDLVEAWAVRRQTEMYSLRGVTRERVVDKINEARRCARSMRCWQSESARASEPAGESATPKGDA